MPGESILGRCSRCCGGVPFTCESVEGYGRRSGYTKFQAINEGDVNRRVFRKSRSTGVEKSCNYLKPGCTVDAGGSRTRVYGGVVCDVDSGCGTPFRTVADGNFPCEDTSSGFMNDPGFVDCLSLNNRGFTNYGQNCTNQLVREDESATLEFCELFGCLDVTEPAPTGGRIWVEAVLLELLEPLTVREIIEEWADEEDPPEIGTSCRTHLVSASTLDEPSYPADDDCFRIEELQVEGRTVTGVRTYAGLSTSSVYKITATLRRFEPDDTESVQLGDDEEVDVFFTPEESDGEFRFEVPLEEDADVKLIGMTEPVAV